MEAELQIDASPSLGPGVLNGKDPPTDPQIPLVNIASTVKEYSDQLGLPTPRSPP